MLGPEEDDFIDASLDETRQYGDAGSRTSPFRYSEGMDVSTAPEASSSKGRITVYCVSEALNRKTLTALLKASHNPLSIHSYVEVVHLRMERQAGQLIASDCFFFDYG